MLVAIQFIPYGRDHTNPRTVQEIKWNTPQTRSLAQDGCFACHSNLTEWPWYTSIAPVSWLTQHDVEDGRAKLNFSEWQRPQEANLEEVVEALRDNKMPPRAVPADPLGGASERCRAPAAGAGDRRELDEGSARQVGRPAVATARSDRERPVCLRQREPPGEQCAAATAASHPSSRTAIRSSIDEMPPAAITGSPDRSTSPRRSTSGPASEPSRAVLVTRVGDPGRAQSSGEGCRRRARGRVQPSTATSPSRTSIATTSWSANGSRPRRGTCGERAAVPDHDPVGACRDRRRDCAFGAIAAADLEGSPPAEATRSTRPSVGVPLNAPSRSTRWRRRAPSARNRRASSTGSPPSIVTASRRPW